MSKFTFFIGTILLVLSIGFAIYFGAFFLQSSDEIKAAIMSAAVIFITTAIIQNKTHKRDVENRHFELKAAAYKDFFDFLFALFSSTKTNSSSQTNEDKITEEMMEMKKKFLIWASPETLMAFDSLADSPNIHRNTEKLIRSMRKDLGHNDSSIEENFFISYFVNHEERENLLEELDKKIQEKHNEQKER